MVTSYNTDEHIFPAIRAGALSYVLKDVGPEELADVVRRAAAGDAVLHPRVAARVVGKLQGARGNEPNAFRELSDRELEVLRLVADGLANAGIAARLFVSEKTVKSHVSNILAKLHLADRTQAAVYAWRHGVTRRAVLARHRRPALALTVAAATCQAAALGLFFAVIEPVNAVVEAATPASVPVDFAALRAQWEYGHAAHAALFAIAFALLLVSVLAETPPAGRRAVR